MMLDALVGSSTGRAAVASSSLPTSPMTIGDRQEPEASHIETPEVVVAMRHEASMAAYRGAPINFAATAVLAVTAALTAALAESATIDLSNANRLIATWLVIVLATTGLRLMHAVRWRNAGAPADSLAPIREYTVGLLFHALIWAALPLLAFADLDAAGRAVALLAAVGVASVEARSLAAIPNAAIVQAGIVLLPASLWLVGSHERGEMAESVALVVVLAVIAAGALSRHRDMLRAVRLRLRSTREAREHRGLELDLGRQIAQLRIESAESRAVMERAQQGLEQRIDERTAALEDRSRDLARQAVTDSLTRLPNRKGINEHLTELLAPIADFAESDAELALLFLDLDDFKEVNDQHGHLAGDQVLGVVAERLRESLPRAGFAARWGGDEFIVVLPGMGRIDQVRHIAEQLRAALCVPIPLEKGVVRTGCSIGIALAPHHGRTPEALIIAADQAVYAAKAERIGRVRVFDIELAKQAGRHHQLAQALPAALELGQLEVAYQPIVGAHDEVATHVEALARWMHPKWGPVSPGEFIPVAEASGHIHTMGRWVLRQACLDAAR